MSKLSQGGLAVDIDDTLCSTARTCMDLLLQEFGGPEGKTVHDLLREFRQPSQVPHWNTPEANTWLSEHLNDPDFLFQLLQVETAKKYLQKIAHIVPIRLYITSRLEHLQSITAHWLQENAFPSAPVVARPDSIRARNWKLEYLAEKYPDIWGIIDDDLHEDLLVGSTYRGKLFLIGESPPPPQIILQPRVIRVASWEDLYQWIEKNA